MKALIYPVMALVCCVFAYFFPQFFITLKAQIVTFLMIIMLGMGLTLTFADFSSILQKKFALVLGAILQFFFMPFIAIGVSKFFSLSHELLIGMVLVGTSAGGTASNVITYLAKGDLALSISMTLFSTILAVFLMPFLTFLYLGQSVQVPAVNMLFDVLKITICPLVIGILLNSFFGKIITRVKSIMPLVSMSAIIFIVAVIISLNTNNIATMSLSVLSAIILHNIIGMFIGYIGSKFCGFDNKTAKTVAIEVGMQNSGLSVVLAMKYFTPLSALPGAIFSIVQNVSGALFAGIFKNKI